MGDLTPELSWDNVYQIEKTDAVLAGPDGIANIPHQHLLNRTQYLYEKTGIDVETILVGKSDPFKNIFQAIYHIKPKFSQKIGKIMVT